MSPPLLTAADPLPTRPHRVLVAGTSGSGKTTVARQTATTLGAPHIEIDSLFHGPGWTPRPTFEADVERFAAQPEWVTEWQYSAVRARLAARADLLIWLDLPRGVVMRQLTRRTFVRRFRRQELWNGNVESPLWTVFTDRDHILRWAWRTHHANSARVLHLAQDRPDLPVVRLRDRDEARAWLTGPLRKSTT
ncbi:AAA family ATPase [Asanoa sp. WMMD1127]|uniref:AAA family ATPase n=1 Tax=Asanoa sp. WMMD1127 TaxID=3016107 RepID=UPI002416E581|nr:AAA family ATPase [Asanoa sp. WMMD1127]MDG4825822.1 AAA family ATPase [Asanoa sp. WMMD1127]